ncbi:UNVERIFIED_CONTAM: hypothetical protein Sradi_4954100 [Sesamum radiatum]|uniref:PGG domain-containing protein n=1 Tax=Sesamum radiatum TaxID=300843 RepID=A0AAW2MDS0_SESRA
MEGKLLEAARSGDLQALYDAVGEDDSILQKLHSFGCVETPLHRASMFGQAEFVREYMRLSSISAHQLSQLNRDGYSPLHLASANAHLEIVDFMLEYVKQNFAIVEHEALKFLIDRKLGSSAECLLNAGDQEGNTILHLATANRKFQTVEYLVKQQNLNVNAENSNCLRPLDMLFVNAFNSNDAYIEETITLAGGSRSQMIPTDVQTGLQHSPPDTSSRSSSSQEEDDKNAKQKWFAELRSGIIVMASVFATLTFQVALTPPGGMWQDWGPNAATSNTTSSAVSTHKPGETILYDLERKKFRGLMWLNTQSFFSSIATILMVLQAFKVDSLAWSVGLNCAYFTVSCIVGEYLTIVGLVTSNNVFNRPGILASLIFWSLILSAALLSFISRTMKLIK